MRDTHQFSIRTSGATRTAWNDARYLVGRSNGETLHEAIRLLLDKYRRRLGSAEYRRLLMERRNTPRAGSAQRCAPLESPRTDGIATD